MLYGILYRTLLRSAYLLKFILRSSALLMRLASDAHTEHLGDTRFLHGDAIDEISGLHHPLGVRNKQELRVLAHGVQQISEPADVGFVKRCVNFVKNAKGARLILEDANEQRERGE